MKDNSSFEPKLHQITCPSLSVDGDSTWTQWFKWRISRVALTDIKTPECYSLLTLAMKLINYMLDSLTNFYIYFSRT